MLSARFIYSKLYAHFRSSFIRAQESKCRSSEGGHILLLNDATQCVCVRIVPWHNTTYFTKNSSSGNIQNFICTNLLLFICQPFRMVVPQKESKWNGIKIAYQYAASLPLSPSLALVFLLWCFNTAIKLIDLNEMMLLVKYLWPYLFLWLRWWNSRLCL